MSPIKPYPSIILIGSLLYIVSKLKACTLQCIPGSHFERLQTRLHQTRLLCWCVEEPCDMPRLITNNNWSMVEKLIHPASHCFLNRHTAYHILVRPLQKMFSFWFSGSCCSIAGGQVIIIYWGEDGQSLAGRFVIAGFPLPSCYVWKPGSLGGE